MAEIELETVPITPTYCGPPPRFQMIGGQCVELSPPSCAPGFVNNPANQFQCIPVQTCTLVITYQASSPQQPTLLPVNGAVCDQAGAELALAVILARMLGAP
jgi:hypothetical protein